MKGKNLFLLLYFFFGISICNRALALVENTIVAIIGATPSELKPIQQEMTNITEKTENGEHYFLGELGGKKVVLVCAGIGSVDIAIATTELINKFNPSYILFSGSAGMINSAKINIGDVILSQKSYSIDYGDQQSLKPNFDSPISPINGKKEPLMFSGHASWLNPNLSLPILAHTANGDKVKAKIIIGTIASSDHFPNTKEDINNMKYNLADAIDMEGNGMMKTCWVFKKPCLLIRGISDLAEPNVVNQNLMWTDKNRILAEKNAGETTIAIIKNL